MAGSYEAGELLATMALDVSEMNQSASKVASMMEGMGGSMDVVAQKLARLETAYTSGAVMMRNSMNDLAKAQESANSAMLRKEQTVNNYLGALKTVAETTKNHTEKVKENTQTIKKNTESMVKNLQNISKASQESAKYLKTINERHFGDVIAGVQLVSETVESLAKRLTGANGAFKRLGDTIRSSIGAASKQASRDIEGLTRAVASLEAATGRGFGNLGRINTSQLKEAQAQTALLRRELQALHNMPSSGNMGGGLGSLGSSFRSARGGAEGLMGSIRNLSIDIFFLQYAAQNLGAVFQTVFGKGISFAAEMETGLIGIAAIIQSTMQLDGEDMNFDTATIIATQAIESLKKAALSTNLTLKELVKTFQAIVAPAANMGLTVKQTTDLAVIGGTAVKTLGLKEDQLVQEIRSMLTGNITARSSTLATALGLKNEDITNAVNAAEGLFEFLKKRMAGFEQASREAGNTLTGIWSNIMDGVEQTQEKAYLGLFAMLKGELAKVQDLFFTIERYKKDEKVDENGQDHEGEIKSSQLNEETVESFKLVADYAAAIYTSIKDWVNSLLDNTQLMGMLSRFAEAIYVSFVAIFENAENIIQCLALIWAGSGGWLRIVISILAYMDALPEVLAFIADHIDIIFGVFVLVEGILPGITTLLGAMDIAVVTVLGNCKLLYGAVAQVALSALAAAEAFLMAQSAGVVAFTMIAAAAVGAAIAIGGIIAGLLYMFYLLHVAEEQTSAADRNKSSNASGSGSIEMEGGMVPGSEQQQDMYEDPMLKNAKDNKSPFGVPEYKNSFEKYLAEAKEKSSAAIAKIEELNQRTVAGKITNKFPREEKAPKGNTGGANDVARDALNEISERYKLERLIVKEGLDDLEFLHKENLVAISDYYDKKLLLQQQNINFDIAELEEKKSVATKASEITKYEGEIALKKRELARLEVVNNRDRAVALRELTTEINKYYHALQQQNGQGDIASGEAFDEKNLKILSQLASEKKHLDGIVASGKALTPEEKERQVRVEAVSRELAKQRTDLVAIGNLTAAIANAERERKKIDNDALEKSLRMQEMVARGAMSEFEYKQRSYVVDNEKAASLRAQLDTLEKEMAIVGQNGDWGNTKSHSTLGINDFESARKKVLDLRKAILDLEHPFNYITTTVMGAFKDGMEEAFTGLISRTKKVSDAFKDMAKAILASLAKLMANRLATSIMAGFLGGGNNTSSWDTMAAKNGSVSWSTSLNHADGGFIAGPGTGTSDSILSRLSNGEYVINAASVASIGRGTLDHINQHGTLPRLAYATGGAVGSISSSASSTGGANGGLGKLKIEIVNNSGTQLKVNSADVSFDLTETVVSLVVDGVTRNVGDSQTILANALRSSR